MSRDQRVEAALIGKRFPSPVLVVLAAAQTFPKLQQRAVPGVWSYVKAQPELDTYHSRRVFLGEQFEPLLAALEDTDRAPVDPLVSSEIDRLDSASVARDWERALARRSSEPEAAITAARALVESVCKTILDDLEVNYTERDDLPKLYRKTAGALDLTPDQYTDEQIKRILGGATSTVEGLGPFATEVETPTAEVAAPTGSAPATLPSP